MEKHTANNLFIRTYTSEMKGHVHAFHQILIPIFGTIFLDMHDRIHELGYGEGIVINSGIYHKFKASEHFRFLVLDLDVLPDRLNDKQKYMFSLDKSLLDYINFIDTKMMSSHEIHIQKLIFELLFNLLNGLNTREKIDRRIQNVLNIIHSDLSQPYTIIELSNIAHLSTSQFKNLFKQQLGVSAMDYITKKRMHQALALVVNSDLPLLKIIELSGYQNMSSFIRKFSMEFGKTPKQYRMKKSSF
ncbi:AraC family transcriptional regulator [Acinetobacter courvalinii]|uniref:helix-turn-helix transcriptional regulator n=1 Tax=Acinetobacter courvalinii TaxID=280147 RepID=UPI0021D2940A|nr:AraC family transcriptional regulator [Acinetobacter courvalinii]MCU4578341.1 AraC family transcriptional regulator [Acinetobacter courvalinii]